MQKSSHKITDLRQEYKANVLLEHNISLNPFQQFDKWFSEACESDLAQPNTMVLSGATINGRPSSRVVLLKGYTDTGFMFYTNYNSRKGVELLANPHAALLFYWETLERQIRIEGTVSKLSKEQSDTYFNQRPKGSRISAVISPQSAVIPSRTVLEEEANKITSEYANNDHIPRPEHWGGFFVKANYFEFWQGRPNRLHDRITYTMQKESQWQIKRLAP